MASAPALNQYFNTLVQGEFLPFAQLIAIPVAGLVGIICTFLGLRAWYRYGSATGASNYRDKIAQGNEIKAYIWGSTVFTGFATFIRLTGQTFVKSDYSHLSVTGKSVLIHGGSSPEAALFQMAAVFGLIGFFRAGLVGISYLKKDGATFSELLVTTLSAGALYHLDRVLANTKDSLFPFL